MQPIVQVCVRTIKVVVTAILSLMDTVICLVILSRTTLFLILAALTPSTMNFVHKVRPQRLLLPKPLKLPHPLPLKLA